MTRSQLLTLTIITTLTLTLAACSPQEDAPSEAATESTAVESTKTVDTTMPEEASPAGSVQLYTLAEVSQHAAPPDDCWIVLEGKVYNVSGFADKHPGSEAVYQGCGKDATTLFETRPMGSSTPHSDKARSFLPNFYIGDLAN